MAATRLRAGFVMASIANTGAYSGGYDAPSAAVDPRRAGRAAATCVINNGKYKKACKVNGACVNWSATVNGEIIKSYRPWVWQETAHRKKYCKQMKNNVLVSTACPCACAGY